MPDHCHANSMDLSIIERPVSSRQSIDGLTDQYSEKGLSDITGRLIWALGQGVFQLAKEVVEIDWEYQRFNNSVFGKTYGRSDGDYETSILHVTNILLSMTPEALKLVITNRLHEAFIQAPDVDLHLPFQHPLPSITSAEQPVIYQLVHCDKAGKRLSKNEYLRIIKDVKRYISTYMPGARKWEEEDKFAKEVDYLDTNINERNWIVGTQGNYFKLWNFKRNTEIWVLHPRRYCNSDRARTALYEWIKVAEMRLGTISDDDADLPIPWSFCYVGWSRKRQARMSQHYDHTSGSCVGYLVESLCFRLFKEKKYFLHSATILNVARMNDAAYAEHALSILSSSYVMFGGFNKAIGGDEGMRKSLRRWHKPSTWTNGLHTLANQRVHLNNKTLFVNRFKMDRFHNNWLEDNSKMIKIEKAKDGYEEAKDCFQEIGQALLKKCK
ncbi:hypothetical protein EAE96_008464 [Botrytis aclada]|nr:hypothetical protein EAE96_008464 [Botrytis aclada]